MATPTPDSESTRDLIARENKALAEAGSFDYVDELYAELIGSACEIQRMNSPY